MYVYVVIKQKSGMVGGGGWGGVGGGGLGGGGF